MNSASSINNNPVMDLLSQQDMINTVDHLPRYKINKIQDSKFYKFYK